MSEQDAAPTPLPRTTTPPIAAIGASAGGLEALQEFFSHTPSDSGIGFIVITHLHPGRESLLPELLSKIAHIPVKACEDDTPVEANTVVVAGGSLLGISDGVLRQVKEGSAPEATYHPIDYFFRALASDQKEQAIGIILSGSGNDGTLGLKAIKAAGGMAMVQDSKSAKHPSMPENAQATGLVDYVLEPGEMPSALVEYCRGPFLRLVRSGEMPILSEDAVKSILVRLRAQTGQDFTCYKKNSMSRRIQRRMNVHHIEEPQEYLRFLRENPREVDALQKELLISVTRFFRDAEAFESLAQAALPRLLEEREEGARIRIWIPGCATGEEAYSVAILLHEQIHKAAKFHDFQIFATDLDERAIDLARSGLYPEGIAADVSPERLEQFFTRENGAYRIHKNIRDLMIFAAQNVISDPPFTRIDLIVCRNLLIYLDSNAQQRILRNFHYALRPGGLLFLGTSETLGESEQLFETIERTHKILRRRETPAQIHPALPLPITPLRRGESSSAERASAGPSIAQRMNRAIERLLLDRFVPCSIVVDDQGTIAYLHGRCGHYLEPEQGPPRNNLPEMAREGLKTTLISALREAVQERHEVKRSGVQVRTNGDFSQVDLAIRPLSAPEALRGLLLVTLHPAPLQQQAHAAPATNAAPPEELAVREQLERELQYTRENLQTMIEELETSGEELKSSNEELQSTNEELQSANEELETSREEMQALNEELTTVNAELQSKIDDLSHANDDMTNLLNGIEVAIVFLDNDLRVKFYTRQAREVIHLIESDIGRPLSDLTSSLQYENLIEDARRVLATLIPRETEVLDSGGRWRQVRLMPYRTAENVINGLVMTVVDIDRIRRATASKQFFESIVQTVREPILVLDGELRVAMANDSFCSSFGVSAQAVEGQRIYEMDNRQWDLLELRRLLEDILPGNQVMNDFRVEYHTDSDKRRIFLLNARRLQQHEQARELILLAFEDVTGGEP